MSDLAQTLITCDIQGFNRQQLQMYCRLLKEQGIDIKLNATNEKLRQHLQEYVSKQAEAVASRNDIRNDIKAEEIEPEDDEDEDDDFICERKKSTEEYEGVVFHIYKQMLDGGWGYQARVPSLDFESRWHCFESSAHIEASKAIYESLEDREPIVDYQEDVEYKGHYITIFEYSDYTFGFYIASLDEELDCITTRTLALARAEAQIDEFLENAATTDEAFQGTVERSENIKKEARVIHFDGHRFTINCEQLQAQSLLQAIALAVSCGYNPTHWQQRDSNAVLLPAEVIPTDYRATYCLIRDCDAAMLSLPEETLKAIKFLHSWDIKWQVRYCCKQWTITTPGLETWTGSSFGDVLLQLHNDRILTDADIQELGKAALT